MRRGYKIVVNTAAGRRRYMQYLIPQVVISDIVDRYDLWINTTNKDDILFFMKVAELFPKINLVWQPHKTINGILSMGAFYKKCCENNTIYIKLDDDMIWFEPTFFEKMVDFRIDNPKFFLVSPLVINNGICDYILQETQKITYYKYHVCEGYNRFWYNGEFAYQLHSWFIDNYLKPKRYEELYSGIHEIALHRFAINAVLWFGETFKEFGGIVSGDDEEQLTIKTPMQLNKNNCFNCNTICAHFSFSVQRSLLDNSNILDQYGEIIYSQGSIELIDLLKQTVNICNYINKNPQTSASIDVGYTQIPPYKGRGTKKWYKLLKEADAIYSITSKKYIKTEITE